MPSKKTATPKETSEVKSTQASVQTWLAAMSYIWILFIVPLLIRRDNAFIQHHARQGFVLFVLEVLVAIFGGIPVLGWFLIMHLGILMAILLAVLGMMHAIQGVLWEMPFLGKFAKKIKL